jgi:hypothetical protein
METSLTDPALWHRIHFGFTITYHYLFPQLTMGLALDNYPRKRRRRPVRMLHEQGEVGERDRGGRRCFRVKKLRECL